MLIPSEALLSALKSASSSGSSTYETEEVIMKLAKKNGQAVLTFEITGLTRVGRKVKVSHDVKREVMRPQDVARLNEPLCPEPDVRFWPPFFLFLLLMFLDRYTFSSLRCRGFERLSNDCESCRTSWLLARATTDASACP
jgi:hypothetical protein